ncbi:uncharacterized protein LOC130994761 [Salvia miltiorrhiza]|uniref:uncharacterized protein LOC130994761 n=1 Tax=Salvia miltiorrhiza TaxID=226208 RepID=UPI0025AD621F|nr:uncharacterized protein LOC130994761 [Salvia miltiorrhiza]
MALPLGKLSLIVGAGLVGSVLAKEGRISNVSDFFSGAFKIIFKQLKQDGPATSQPKPRNDSLMQQVNSLREELQLLASNRSVTIVTGERSASGKYGIVIITIVVGYGYIWWKGWKISDMMFATRRGLNDACSSVAKQLDTVYSSVSVTKRDLSSRINRVGCKIDEAADDTTATKETMSVVRGEVKSLDSKLKNVTHVVQSLKTRVNMMVVRQNGLNSGVENLVGFGYAWNLENSKSMEQIGGAASSFPKLALEDSKASPSRTVSLPIEALGKTLSPSTANGSLEKRVPSVPPASGLKELYGMSDVGVLEPSCPLGSNGIHASEETNIDNSSGRLVGRFSGLFARSRSTVPSAK